jgi:hypothetical protein
MGKAPKSAAETPHEQLTVMIPAGVMTALKVRGAQQRATLRALVLRALKRDGYPVTEADLADRRQAAQRKRSG